jgi:hypothetical protein
MVTAELRALRFTSFDNPRDLSVDEAFDDGAVARTEVSLVADYALEGETLSGGLSFPMSFPASFGSRQLATQGGAISLHSRYCSMRGRGGCSSRSSSGGTSWTKTTASSRA